MYVHVSPPQCLRVCAEDRQRDDSNLSKASGDWLTRLVIPAPPIRENIFPSQDYVEEPLPILVVAWGLHIPFPMVLLSLTLQPVPSHIPVPDWRCVLLPLPRDRADNYLFHQTSPIPAASLLCSGEQSLLALFLIKPNPCSWHG